MSDLVPIHKQRFLTRARPSALTLLNQTELDEALLEHLRNQAKLAVKDESDVTFGIPTLTNGVGRGWQGRRPKKGGGDGCGCQVGGRGLADLR